MRYAKSTATRYATLRKVTTYSVVSILLGIVYTVMAFAGISVIIGLTTGELRQNGTEKDGQQH
jgi:hypothetical protein